MTIHEVRAIEAYLRRGGTEQSTTPQTFKIGNKSYVVLSGVRRILAVYRIEAGWLPQAPNSVSSGAKPHGVT